MNQVHRAFQAYFQSLPPLKPPLVKPLRPGMLPDSVKEEIIESPPRITAAHIRRMAEILDEKLSEYEIAEMVLEAYFFILYPKLY
jgi:hypothetical protein